MRVICIDCGKKARRSPSTVKDITNWRCWDCHLKWLSTSGVQRRPHDWSMQTKLGALIQEDASVIKR